MKRLRLLVSFCSLLGFATLLRAEPAATAVAPTIHLDDPSMLLPADPAWRQDIEAKLSVFEKAHAVRMLLEFHEKSPPPEEDSQPGVYMRALATQRGTISHGVLAVYFADEDDWRVWIGDELTSVFVGRPGTAKEFTESGAMHEAKEAFLAATFARSDAAFAARQQAAPADQPPPRGERLAWQAGALVDGLIGKLTPQ